MVWVHLGFGLIYFLAAMSSIDRSIYEAALIDGAGFWETFLRVTIPSIRFAVEFWVVFSFIEVFARMFSFIYTLTRGGPGYGTFTLEYGIFVQGFVELPFGLLRRMVHGLVPLLRGHFGCANPHDAKEKRMKKTPLSSLARVLLSKYLLILLVLISFFPCTTFLPPASNPRTSSS